MAQFVHNLKRISPEVAISLLNLLVPLKLHLLEAHRKVAEMATSLLQILQFSYQKKEKLGYPFWN